MINTHALLDGTATENLHAFPKKVNISWGQTSVDAWPHGIFTFFEKESAFFVFSTVLFFCCCCFVFCCFFLVWEVHAYHNVVWSWRAGFCPTMGPGGVALASYPAAIGTFNGGQAGRYSPHLDGGSPCSRPLLVIFLLFLLLRAESLPTHGDVERSPGPDVDRKATSDTAHDASLRSSNLTQETQTIAGTSGNAVTRILPDNVSMRERRSDQCPLCKATFRDQNSSLASHQLGTHYAASVSAGRLSQFMRPTSL